MNGALVKLDAATRELARVETAAEAKALYDKLETLSQYARRYRLDQTAQNEIAVVKLRTARKGGTLLAAAIGPTLGIASRGERRLPEDMSWAMSSRWQAIREEVLPDDVFEEHVAAVDANGEDVTLSGVLSLARKLQAPAETPPLPDGKYRTIVADPPWPLERRTVRPDETGPRVAGTSELGALPFPYPTMSVEQISDLPIKERAHEGAHLYLWTVNAFLEQSYGIARAWGFKPSTLLVWSKKPMGIGLGGTFTITTEFVLFARRGQCDALERADRTAFEWKRQNRHSAKPGEFFALVERTSPEPRLELFAREQRSGWTVWGNEEAVRAA